MAKGSGKWPQPNKAVPEGSEEERICKSPDERERRPNKIVFKVKLNKEMELFV